MADISKFPVSDFDAAVRLLSGGTNVAIYNDLGLPSIYVRRDKGAISDVIDGGPDTTHYAFKVNGAEVPAFYMGKYLATVYKGRALSLPLQTPTTGSVATSNRGNASSNNVNFDNAKIWCEANGLGFHLPTIAEYAWIALLSRKNGTVPRGNNNYGADISAKYEKGIAATFDSYGRLCKTLTGSGPATWNDNWQPDGICDLNGCAIEWQGGYRTVDGELQIFPDNDAAMQYEQNNDSTRWKAILQDGTLVEPGTDGTLKWDYNAVPIAGATMASFCLNTKVIYRQPDNTSYGKMSFVNLPAAEGIIVPDRLKALALMPDGNGTYGEDSFYIKNLGEYIVGRGGSWAHGQNGGVFFSYGIDQRTYSGSHVSFRPAFIPGI